MKYLAIITTHPIQYNAPLFKLLHQCSHISIKVFYTWGEAVLKNKYDPGFGKTIEWDLPLLEGYDHYFVKNISLDPGTHHFMGIINPSLNKEIEEWKPDALLVFGWSFHSHLKCIRYFHRKMPVFFRGDSTLLDEKPGLKQKFRRLFLKWVYSHIDFAIYVGENNKKYFQVHGLQPAQLIYGPHAIDNNRFAEPDEVYIKEANKIRENLGIKQQDLVLLFAGKMEPKKNPLFLVHLLNSFKDERLKILFVGGGVLLPQIKSLAALDDRIKVLGFQNQRQMPAIYRVADLFILPSVGPGETWGLALNEAMASGIAIAATDKTGSAADLIGEGVNGLIIHSNNVKPLQELVLKSLENKETLKGMGRQSSLKIQFFNFNQFAIAIEQLLTRRT